MATSQAPRSATRMIGTGLLWGGAGIGCVSAVALLPLAGVHGLPWLVGVGLIKLGIAGSLGVMAGGAALRRTAMRLEGRRNDSLLPEHTPRSD
jgi:hypothetical protein